eukprot:TRINITY_DN7076_c0_g1_i7.p1 TRINITY_DN7076_c0_g1~~TRINITY_DN7076_c0_g1_i7.p1  ORF type:complete len:199 (+),score=36.95 TRINITY_DN7076_c0_g1_i7:78-599(+)
MAVWVQTPLALQIKLPSSETVSIDVTGSDDVSAVRQKVAEAADLELGTFALSFEGEELHDENLVSEYPFQDGSILEVIPPCWEQAALLKLHKMGFKDAKEVNSDGMTGLHVASRDGQLDVVRYVLEVENAGMGAGGSEGNNPSPPRRKSLKKIQEARHYTTHLVRGGSMLYDT